MKMWCTTIWAIKPGTGVLTKYCGPNVPGINAEDAQNYCEQNELGYCKVDGQLIEEIPCKLGTYEADFSKTINYENLN